MTGSSPILHDGMVIVQADVQKDSFIAAYDLKTGKQVWAGPIGDAAAEVAAARAAWPEWAAHSVAYRSEALRRFTNVVRARELGLTHVTRPQLLAQLLNAAATSVAFVAYWADTGELVARLRAPHRGADPALGARGDDAAAPRRIRLGRARRARGRSGALPRAAGARQRATAAR